MHGAVEHTCMGLWSTRAWQAYVLPTRTKHRLFVRAAWGSARVICVCSTGSVCEPHGALTVSFVRAA
eukprot:321411-Chlamydomonas_euryale.AAC.1